MRFMSKVRITLFCVVFGAVALGAIPDKLDTLYQETIQRQRASEARALLQNARSTIQETNVRLAEIAGTGSLNTIDPEIKKTLLAGWLVLQEAEAGFEDPNLTALLDWRPNQ